MKTFLYVEESENDFVNALILRQDIKLILIRFLNCLSFSEQHLLDTADIPVFILDQKSDFAGNCERLAAFLQEVSTGIDVFFNDSEFNQVYIQRIARELHLPGALSSEQADIVRDKVHMKDLLCRKGIPCPAYTVLFSRNDAVACGLRWGYPFIIKWRIGVSSIEVYKVESPSFLESLNLDYSTGRYMAEQYQSDKIWCLDAIVSDGKVIQNLYTWLPFTNLDFAENKTRFCQMAVGTLPQEWQFNPQMLTQQIVSALSLQNGYLHLEAFISPDGLPRVCEFAWRTPGDHMLKNFTLLYGISVENFLIDVLLGNPVSVMPETQGCVADVFLPMVEGVIRRISSLAGLRESCGILAGEIRYCEGERLISRRTYTDSTGWVQVAGIDIPTIMKKIDKVYNSFILEME